MKSKLLLLCLLSMIVGNVFAEPLSQSQIDEFNALLVKYGERDGIEEIRYIVSTGDVNNVENGSSALMVASRNGYTDIMQELIKLGADVNIGDSYTGSAALDYAVYGGQIKAVSMLISAGANVNAVDEYGSTVLMSAVASKQAGIVRLLLRSGVDLEAKGYIGEYSAYDTAYVHAHMLGHDEIAKILKDAGAVDRISETPMMIAAKNGNIEEVKELLANGVSVDDTNYQGITPLMLSSSAGHVEIAKLLIENKANLNATDAIPESGLSAIVFASTNGHLEIVNLLIANGVDVNMATLEGTPLIFAVKGNHTEVVKSLINAGANIDESDMISGYTALMIAAKANDVDMVKLLVKSGADINIKSHEGDNAIYFARMDDNDELMAIFEDINNNLYKKGVNAVLPLYSGDDIEDINKVLKNGINATNRHGKTPLMLAAEARYVDLVKALIIEGADVNAKADYDVTALQMAYDKEVIEALLENGAKINAKDKNGKTALANAAHYGRFEILEVLIEKGANINMEDKEGMTPLMYAAQAERTEEAELLIKAGAKLNEVSEYTKDSALIIAISQDNSHGRNIAKMLIEAGADVNIVNRYDRTALYMALYEGEDEIVRMLLAKGADVNKADEYGTSPLIRAVQSDSYESVKLLLARGADVHHLNKYDESALYYAKKNDQQRIVQILITHGAKE